MRSIIVALALVVAAPAFAGSFEDNLDKLLESGHRLDQQRAAERETRSRELMSEAAAIDARQNAERQAESIDRLTDAVEHQNVILCCPRY